MSAIADLELDNLGADAWSEGLVREGVVGNLPTISYLVAEVDGAVVGHATASVVADIAELQRIAVDPRHRRTGVATELLDAVVALAREAEPTGCCSRCARTTTARSRSTPRAASSRSTGAAATTATAPRPWCCAADSWAARL